MLSLQYPGARSDEMFGPLQAAEIIPVKAAVVFKLSLRKATAVAVGCSREVERTLAAAVENDQFGWIATDNDVSDFLNRVAIPRKGSLSSPGQLAILERVAEDQRDRAARAAGS